MSPRIAVMFDLFVRHARVLRHAWSERKRMDGTQRRGHEADFLPAALALRDSPLHPAPRIAMALIILFAVIAVSWAVFGRIDIVASASGKLIPDDRSKVIQPVETARVAAIHVRDGQRVAAGDLLIELDAIQAQADITRINQDLLTARIESAIAHAMLASLEATLPPRLLPVFEVDAVRLAAEQRRLDGRHGELRARLDQLDAEIARREAEWRSTRELVEKLVQTEPIARQRAQDYKDLLEKNFVSRHGYLEREQARIEQERDLAAQRARLEEIRAALLEGQRQRAALIAETRRATLDLLNQAEQKTASLTQEMIKAEGREGLLRLTAPVTGTVQQLAVHTVGGVVTPAQPLLVIVPGDHPLEVEAFVENKDIGFVHVGQPAEVKVETFPFTRYGILRGKVMQVSSDALQDEKRGLVYATRVRLEKTRLAVDGRSVNLAPGMAVTAEIKTGQRRVIEYFLSPLLQYADESFHER